MLLSHSRITTFAGDWGCPYKFYLKYIEKVEPDPKYVSPMKLGSTVHTGIENVIAKVKEDQDWYYIFRHQIAKIIKDNNYSFMKLKELPYAYRIRAKKMYLNGLKFIIYRGICPSQVEVELEDKKYGIKGVLDIIDEETKTIIDWKTGKNAKLTDGYILQGNMYAVLSLQITGQIPNVGFVFLEQYKAFQCPVTPDTMGEAIEYVNMVRLSMDECKMMGVYPRNPSYFKCMKCSVGITCRKREIAEVSIS